MQKIDEKICEDMNITPDGLEEFRKALNELALAVNELAKELKNAPKGRDYNRTRINRLD